MTMPAERTRALRWGYEFLVEAATHGGCPGHFRTQAAALLRHYPTPKAIAAEAEANSHDLFGRWLGLEVPAIDQPDDSSNAHDATAPAQRSQALCRAGEFLVAFRCHPDVPEQLQKQVTPILRHYPEPHVIASRAASNRGAIGAWLWAETDPLAPQER